MFDFQNLEVYKQAKDLHKDIILMLKELKNIDHYLCDQFRRASLSIVLNIAEGTGKFSKADKRNFYFMARGSTYECVALLEILLEGGMLRNEVFDQFYLRYELISKMLFGLIKSQQ